MKEDFYIGQIFDGIYPPEAAEWCNENNALIAEIKDKDGLLKYQIQEIPAPTEDEKKASVRSVRDNYLRETDYTQLLDSPYSEEEIKQYAAYRVYLRNYTNQENWWEQNPMTFDEWKKK